MRIQIGKELGKFFDISPNSFERMPKQDKKERPQPMEPKDLYEFPVTSKPSIINLRDWTNEEQHK